MSDTNIVIETLTPKEAVEELRSMGMKISIDTLRDGIEQKIFPFGDCIQTKNGNPVYEIYRKKFDAWVEEIGTPAKAGSEAA